MSGRAMFHVKHLQIRDLSDREMESRDVATAKLFWPLS